MSSFVLADDFACAIDNTAHRQCWCNGTDQVGEMGAGLGATASTPTQFTNISTIAITASSQHGCAVDTNSLLWCWGNCQTVEAIGQTSPSAPMPVAVNDATGQQVNGCMSVSTRDSHTCAVCTNEVLCFGDDGDNNAVLGRGANSGTQQRDPVARPVASVAMTMPFIRVSAFDGGACALTNDHKQLFCWGDGAHGELGNGGKDRNVPTPVGTPP
jgi:alpha-tubulin suppressor-like RCC1 family protein